MNHEKVYCAGTTIAIKYAKQYLKQLGIPVSETPEWDTKHLLLDIPSFRDGFLRSGRSMDTLLSSLPGDIIVWGGNLDHPALNGLRTVDLLKDEQYLAQNAAITAHCALTLAVPLLRKPLAHTPTLIIGWGRIGKCLGQKLKAIGNDVIIATRNSSHQSALQSLGYRSIDSSQILSVLPEIQLIFNTAPSPVLSTEQTSMCNDCILMDLASQRGIEGDNVIWARGLPGIHAPESSGKLIADTIIRLMKEADV